MHHGPAANLTYTLLSRPAFPCMPQLCSFPIEQLLVRRLHSLIALPVRTLKPQVNIFHLSGAGNMTFDSLALDNLFPGNEESIREGENVGAA